MRTVVSRAPILAIFVLLSALSAQAHNKVVVIPMGADGWPLQHVISVAKVNGDFTDPAAAMNSITDANETNRYLLVIGPGVYTLTETLVMQEYVDITGSGRNATKLTGAISTNSDDETSALVQGADNAELRGMSIENSGEDIYSIGIYNNSVSPTLSDLGVTTSGGSFQNSSVFNKGSSSPRMTEMTVSALGGTFNIGVRNIDSASPTMSGITVIAAGVISNFGVMNRDSSSPRMSDMTVTATGGNFCAGVSNYNSASPRMSNMNVIASGGSDNNYGIYNSTNSTSSRIDNSVIEGTTNSVYDGGGDNAEETYISDTILIGPVSDDPVCSFVFYPDGTPLDAACAPPPP